MKIQTFLAALILCVATLSACGGAPAVVETPVAAEPGPALANDGTRQVGEQTTCPVSGDDFTIKADSPKAEYNGGTYYFCCAGCVDKFNADPAKFAGVSEEAPADAAPEAAPADAAPEAPAAAPEAAPAG